MENEIVKCDYKLGKDNMIFKIVGEYRHTSCTFDYYYPLDNKKIWFHFTQKSDYEINDSIIEIRELKDNTYYIILNRITLENEGKGIKELVDAGLNEIAIFIRGYFLGFHQGFVYTEIEEE